MKTFIRKEPDSSDMVTELDEDGVMHVLCVVCEHEFIIRSWFLAAWPQFRIHPCKIINSTD